MVILHLGQERFHALGPIYYRDSHAAVLVYDITDQDSFVKVFSNQISYPGTVFYCFNLSHTGTELGERA